MNKNIKDLIEYSNGGILSKEIEKGVTLFSMSEKTEISEHTSSKRAFIYVLEGEGIFYLGKNEIDMKEDLFISIKENEKHSLKAVKNMSFILFLTN